MCDFKWYWREGATLVRAILLPGWAAPGGRIIGSEQLRQLGDIRRDPPRLIPRALVSNFAADSSLRLLLEIDIGEFLQQKHALKGSLRDAPRAKSDNL
jgi:hypothetical protein